jgi:signal transduction histidine kinase/ligand-binding sensor domain-containing protein
MTFYFVNVIQTFGGLACFVLIFAFGAELFAQTKYRFDSWTTNEGLPQNSVHSIVQTNDGYLWFTTLDGLVRFDGVRFTVFNKSNSKNLPSNRLNSLFTADGATLWIITEDQILVSFAGGAFQKLTTADGLPSDKILGLVREFDGSILAYAREGIARFDGQRFSIIKGGDGFDGQDSRPYFAPSGTFWELNRNVLTASANGVTNEYLLPANLKKYLALKDLRPFDAIEMLETGDGELWFAVGKGIYKVQNGTVSEVLAEGMPRSRILAVSRDKAGNVWFGTSLDGACRFSQNRFDCFNSKNSTVDDYIFDIFSDREGTLWLGANEKGIYRVTEQFITSLPPAEGLAAKKVYPILEDSSGAVWIGGIGGLSKYDHGRITNYLEDNGSQGLSVSALYQDRTGRLWIGKAWTISFIENGKLYDAEKTPGLDLSDINRPYDIKEDKHGVIWIAAVNGLYKYDSGTVIKLTTADGLPSNDIKIVLESNDGETLWIGTSNGLAELKNGRITAFTEQNGLAGNLIRALYEDETGTLWIGTYDSGLVRLKNGVFTVIKKENGLFSDGVFQILKDEQRNFWMSSNQGIYRVSRAQLNDFADGKIGSIVSTGYNKSDGMPTTEANGGAQPAGVKMRSGELWFPTQEGVAIIRPEAVTVNPLPPPVVIETVRIDNQNTTATNNEIQILAGQENLEIDYTGLSFIQPEQLRFRYRLENLEDTWTEAGTRRTAFYPHVAPGEYTFRVIAANSDNVWNETGATLKISVKPPFYRTWFFLAVCTAAIGLFVFGIYRARVSQLQKAQRTQEDFSRRLINAHETERRRIAGELHDSIGQSLAMIKNRAVFSQMKTAEEETKEHLEIIAAQTSQTINEVREISYNLRPYLLERLGLRQSIKSLFDEVADLGQIKVIAEIDDIDSLFDAEQEMNLFRIIQECVNNIVKHSQADFARLSIRKETGVLMIFVEDDGKGFDPNDVTNNGYGEGGFGLIGMVERVKMLGGWKTIESAPGEGTKISIVINLDKTT